MLLVNQCFNAVRKDCYKYIKFQETKTEKFKNKNRMIKAFLIPLCYWIKNKTNNRKPLLLGLSGGQGTGKTTISSILLLILKKYFKLKVFRISIDDFYKTRKERISLSKIKHPLLRIRGVPGTHDIKTMVRFFNKVKSKKFTQINLPRFDKSVDDRCKRNLWYNIYSKPDVVIFEGCCIGARPQKVFDLKKTVNLIEKTEDKSLRWRKYVNKQLETKYKKLFNKLDGLIYLKVRNFCLLRKWRLKQEKKLWLKTSSKKNLKIMNKKEVINFMSTYQRITQHMFNDMPKISSVIMNLNDKHQINKIQFIN